MRISTASSTPSYFLPESWDADRDRCREAGIPDTVTYRPKWKIALELYDRAIGNGLRDWLTFDEGYGSKPELLLSLTAVVNGIIRRSAAERYRLARSAAEMSPGPTTITIGTEAVESPAWPVEAHRLGGSMSG